MPKTSQIFIRGDLVIAQDGKVLGRLERPSLSIFSARRCPTCDEPVKLGDWEYHQFACHETGWGRVKSCLSRFTAPLGKPKKPAVDWVAELASFLEK